MNIVFAGTPEFAAVPLQALLDSGLPVRAVYTQPDRPAGRGRRLSPSAVKQVALDAGLPVYQPVGLKDTATQEELAALQPDLLLVIAYGLILPQPVLDLPRLGCVNLHASLLPRWRGAAPIQRAIEAGDTRTGLCLMQMEAGLDTGPVLARAEWPVDDHCSAGELHDALATLGARELPGWLGALQRGELRPQPQDDAQASYAHKLNKAEASLDWRRPAAELARQVRAFNPWPVACTTLADAPLKIWRASAVAGEGGGQPGEVTGVNADGMTVRCGEGALRVTELQFAGGRRMAADEAARGHSLLGRLLGS